MSTTISTSHIARAAQVSQRSVQIWLKRNRTRPEGAQWRFDLQDFPAIVNEIQGARKRKRKNAFTKSLSPAAEREDPESDGNVAICLAQSCATIGASK